MHVGTQQFNTSERDLEYLARHGVRAKNENNFIRSATAPETIDIAVATNTT